MWPMESGTIIIGVKVESLESLRNQRTYLIITKRDGMVYKRIRKNKNENSLIAISDSGPGDRNIVFPTLVSGKKAPSSGRCFLNLY